MKKCGLYHPAPFYLFSIFSSKQVTTSVGTPADSVHVSETRNVYNQRGVKERSGGQNAFLFFLSFLFFFFCIFFLPMLKGRSTVLQTLDDPRDFKMPFFFGSLFTAPKMDRSFDEAASCQQPSTRTWLQRSKEAAFFHQACTTSKFENKTHVCVTDCLHHTPLHTGFPQIRRTGTFPFLKLSRSLNLWLTCGCPNLVWLARVGSGLLRVRTQPITVNHAKKTRDRVSRSSSRSILKGDNHFFFLILGDWDPAEFCSPKDKVTSDSVLKALLRGPTCGTRCHHSKDHPPKVHHAHVGSALHMHLFRALKEFGSDMLLHWDQPGKETVEKDKSRVWTASMTTAAAWAVYWEKIELEVHILLMLFGSTHVCPSIVDLRIQDRKCLVGAMPVEVCQRQKKSAESSRWVGNRGHPAYDMKIDLGRKDVSPFQDISLNTTQKRSGRRGPRWRPFLRFVPAAGTFNISRLAFNLGVIRHSDSTSNDGALMTAQLEDGMQVRLFCPYHQFLIPWRRRSKSQVHDREVTSHWAAHYCSGAPELRYDS